MFFLLFSLLWDIPIGMSDISRDIIVLIDIEHIYYIYINMYIYNIIAFDLSYS